MASEAISATKNISSEEISSIISGANSSEALIWIDNSKVVVSCNAAAQDILGHSSDDFKGIKLQSILKGRFPDSRISLRTLKTKNAEFLIAAVSSSPVLDGRKNNTGFVIRILDTAAPNYVPFDFPVNKSPVSFIIVHNGRIVIANRQVQIDTGFSEEYLLNRDLLSFIHPEDAEGFSLNVIQQLKGHILEGLEFRVVCKNGDEKWLISKVAAAMYNGKPSILLNYMDITASKFAEEELRKRESFNFALFQHNPVPTIIVDVEGRVVKSNLAQRNSWNSLPEIGDRMYQDYGGNHGIDMRTELMECINSGQVKEFPELKYGDEYFSVTISPFSNGAMIMAVDITERKNAEERLRESEEKYRFLTENINDLIAMTDREGNYIYVNEAHHKVVGYNAEDLLGRSTLEFLHPEDADRMTIALLNTQNKDETFDIRYKCKDGSYKWIQTRGSLFVDDNGKLEKVIAVANDITERKQFEEILRESELRFRQISELSPFPVWIRTSDGRTDYINPRFTMLFGYTIEDIPTIQSWFELTYPDAKKRRKAMPAWNLDQSDHSGQDAVKREFRVTCKDGNTRVVTARSLLMQDGNTYTVFHDITEAELMKKALQESEEKFRTIFENANDEIIYLDNSGTVIDRNTKGENLLGYTSDEVIGKNITEFGFSLGEEQTNAMVELFDDARMGVAGQGLVDLELKHKNGNTIMVQASISKLKKDNKMEGLLVILRDMTERVEAEATIHTQAHDLGERLKELHCLYSIAKLTQTPGISLENLIQSTVSLIPYAWEHPEVTGARITIDDLSIKTDDFEETEWRQFSPITAGGQQIGTMEVCYLEKRPLKDEGPFTHEERELITTLSEVLGTFVEHRRATEALRESEAKYSAVVKQAHDGIVIIQDGVYKFANDAWSEICMYHQDEMIGMTFDDILLPRSRDLVLKRMKQRLEGKNPPPIYEVGIKVKDGTKKRLEVSSGIIQYEGKPATMSILRDVTRRKQDEQEQKRLLASLEDQNKLITASHKKLATTLKDLERANDHLKKSQEQLVESKKMVAIGELASGVAHEVNNPLMAISGHTQLLLEDAVDDDSIESLTVIQSETRRATDIVQNLLSFARKQNTEISNTSLNEIIEDTIKLRVYELTKNNIEVITKLNRNNPPIKANPQRLKQVFLNIINNAAQAMREANEGGTLTIKTRKTNDEKIEIAFSDNGPGISPENLDRVFEPFFTTKDVGKGTGLGLSICYGIIKNHGGEISVKSGEGKGTTFAIELPIVSGVTGTNN